MSRSHQRISSVVKSLTDAYENSAYRHQYDHFGDYEPLSYNSDQLLLSVVIPARNEFPNIAHTIHSILNCWEADGFDPKDIEIIVVNNASDDYNDPRYQWDKPGDRGTVWYLQRRGIYYSRTLRILYDPIAGNHSARNKGARIARGKYLFFSDAHMSYRPGTFKYGLKAVDESGGLVHGGIAWMGAYPPHHGGIGMQYTIKLGEEWKGTWNPYAPWTDKWFYIPAQGHCTVFARRDQFLDFGGYPDIHRSYGGGEFFTNMKWWMYGSTVAVEPRVIGYHLASGRGYSWHHDDYIHNVYNCAYALGCDDWLERTHLNYLRRGNKEVLEKMLDEAKKEMAGVRAEIERRKVKTFNQLLVEKPWDEKNMERGGKKNSSMLIFHNTWVRLLYHGLPEKNIPPAPRWVQEKYEQSETQKKLAKFIETELKDYIYRRDEYEIPDEVKTI